MNEGGKKEEEIEREREEKKEGERGWKERMR